MVCAPAQTLHSYHPRRPRDSPLYKLVNDYFDEFQRSYPERYQERYGFWRPIIGEVVRKFLRCGDLAATVPTSRASAPTAFNLRCCCSPGVGD